MRLPLRIKRYFIIIVCTLVLYLLFTRSCKNSENGEQRVAYVVLTSEKTLTSRGLAIWKTWARNCSADIVFACNCKNLLKYKETVRLNQTVPNELRQFSKVADLPILDLNITEDYSKMGEKVLLVLRLMYEKYMKTTRWYFMADDDTYVYPENVKKFTRRRNDIDPFYYGFKFNHHAGPNGYIGGGAGILFPRSSMKRLVDAITSHKCDQLINSYGDVTIGLCAKLVNVTTGNSTDEKGKPVFNYDTPLVHYSGEIPQFLWQIGVHNRKSGRDCCSAESISFHRIKSEEMYAIYENKTLLKDLFF